MLRFKPIALLVSALVWTSYVLIVIAWTPLVLGFRLLTFPFDRNRRLVGRLFHRAAVVAGDVTPFWTFRIAGAAAIDPSRAHVFVANHSSFTDIFLVVRLPWPAARWWDDVVHTCSNIRLFCNHGHASSYSAGVRSTEAAIAAVAPLVVSILEDAPHVARDTRPLLVKFARRAYEIVAAEAGGPRKRGMRP